ncbi:hypothetical protein LCGC14_1516490 [marine sediment metagenome]|uniref:Uncharacterized protein n=1 Tax=marine sediment metagenome TaxID=412755 RepID=A0A0F9JKP2_9ZZZZ
MTALSKNMGSILQVKFGNIQNYVAGGTIWRGSLVVLNLVDGLAYAATDTADDGDVTRLLMVGFAQEKALVGEDIRVRQDGKLERTWQGSSAGKKPGRLACVYDDATVQAASAGKVVVGRITEVGTTKVFVDLVDRPVRIATGSYD